MKKILVAVLLFLGVFAQANDMDLWKKSTLNKIIQRGELRVGLDPGYMPFEMKDKKGNIIGFDVDLAKQMAKGMGVKLKIIPTAFDGIVGGLIADKFDMIISAITITQKRNLKINFSSPYMSIGQTLLVANKHKGIRAALCHDAFTASMARAHNDANILAFGQRVVGIGVIEDMINAFINTPFEGGRHEARVKKIEVK